MLSGNTIKFSDRRKITIARKKAKKKEIYHQLSYIWSKKQSITLNTFVHCRALSRGVTKYFFLLVIDWKVVFLNSKHIDFIKYPFKMIRKSSYRAFCKSKKTKFKISKNAEAKKLLLNTFKCLNFLSSIKKNIFDLKKSK